MLRHHFFNFRNKVVVTFPHLISLLDIEQISAQSSGGTAILHVSLLQEQLLGEADGNGKSADTPIATGRNSFSSLV
jgi:hypothetical protein